MARWRQTLAQLCDALAAKPDDARLKWVGPDMGVRMFATARQMASSVGSSISLGTDASTVAQRARTFATNAGSMVSWRVPGRPR